MQKYLPSKKFMFIIGGGLLLVVIIFLVFYLFSKREEYKSQNNSALQIDHQTVAGLVQTDTDNDGIPDWEEALWGTDPKNPQSFDGIPDATYIANKKKALNINPDSVETDLTETDKFARNFFTTFAAMKASGQVDSTNINNFSNALGQNVLNQQIIDQYTEKDIKKDSNNTFANAKKYYAAVQALFNKYKTAGIGDELFIVGNQLSNSPEASADSLNSLEKNNTSGPIDDKKLLLIAAAYQGFAKNIIQLAVPTNLIQIHLQIANYANNTGISVLNMTKVTADPIVGLSGLSQYQKYSDGLIQSVTDLETIIFGQDITQ